MASGLWLVFVHNNDDSLSQFNLVGFTLSHYWVSKDNILLKKKEKNYKIVKLYLFVKVSINFLYRANVTVLKHNVLEI